MTTSNSQYSFLFFLALLSCGFLTPLIRRVAIRFAIVDRPNQDHKTHREPIPYLGGLAIIGSVWIVTISGAFTVQIDRQTLESVLGILLPATFVGLIGLWDDIKNLKPLPRFIAQTGGALVTAILIISTNTVGSPTGNQILDSLITIVWIVGITNAINFFDNLDGGASGTVAISSMGLFLLSATSNQNYLAALAMVLAGSTSGFLFWNRNPARIYMGDAGALFLGMMISSLLVRFEPNPINQLAGFAVPIFLMAIPILDTSVAVLSRIARSKSPFEGGQDHLSHRLIRKNISRREVAFRLWGLTALFVMFSVLLSNIPFALEGLVLSTSTIFWLALFVWFFAQDHENRRFLNSQ